MPKPSNDQTLDVISASAGSGKTFNLASRFIDLLVRNPQNYQHILAVTFTIKATAEMMDRIVKDLYTIVAPIANDDKKAENEKKKKEIIDRQIEELRGGKAKLIDGKMERPRTMDKEYAKLTDQELAQKIVGNCKTALRLILNDYSQFNISTIDSFVQKVLRAFAFEQGFMSNYGVELDTRLVISQAIDMLMHDMKTDKELRDWMIEFVRSKMDDSEGTASWEIDKDIKKLAFTLTSDEGRVFAEDMAQRLQSDPKFLVNLKSKLKDIKKSSEDEIKRASDAYISSLSSEFDKNKLKGKSKSPFWTLYGYILSGDIDKIFGALEKLDPNAESGNTDMNNATKIFANKLTLDVFYKYYTAKEILRNIYVLGILSHISKRIQEYTSQNHVMLLAKSNELLQELIGNSSVPFIYEKIGTRFNHIMIDEFQDTSKTQWNNFEPLIANSLHNNNRCLLVGDIKQAIYRWRNSDWHTLADLNSQSSSSEVCPYVNPDILEHNWRSYGNIVDFNNDIFKKLSKAFSEKIGELNNMASDPDIDRIYEKCSQIVPSESKKDKGYVEHKVIVSSKDLATEAVLKDMTCKITELKETYKYNYSDILVLVRDHKDGAIAMDYLAKHGISVVSSDSLMVCKSQLVKGIIAAMRFISNPYDKQSLLTYVAVQKSDDDISHISELWKDNDELGQVKDQLLELRGKGLLEMTNAIISLMPQQLRENDFIFVEAFVDTLRTYMTNHHVNISDFIEYVDNIENSLSITAPSNQEAVSIMTIHKSKGLERKVVLIPFGGWDIEPTVGKCPVIWAKNLPAPFDDLNTIPITYSSKLSNTYFSSGYAEEKKMIYIDNLNLMYVALTRAKEVLMVWTYRNEKRNSSNSPFTAFLKDAIDSMELEKTQETIEVGDDQTELIFEVNKKGVLSTNEDYAKADKNQLDDNSTEIIKPYDFHEYTDHIQLTQKNSQKAISIEEIEKYEGMIDYGTVMHQIMASIRCQEDVDSAVDNAILDGSIDSNKGMRLKNTLRRKISQEKIKPWFSVGKNNVYTEATFLTSDSDMRPDRIVKLNDGTVAIIDYKFGYTVDPDKDDSQTEEYRNQVKKYITTLQAAGFTNVRGYLWYFHRDVVKEITV